MTVSLNDAIRRVRSVLDESVSKFWTNTEITDWVNDGLRDLARKTEDLMTFDTSTVVAAGVAKYSLPADTIRVHRCEYVPTGSTQTYPLQPSTYGEMDQIWGINQASPSSYPSFFVIWGYPGGSGSSAMKVQLYPVPSAGGVLNIFYYKLPYRFADPEATPTELVKTLDVPEGWDDLVVTYAEWRALRKDRDPRWVEAKQLYDSELDYLVNVTRQLHDQQRMIMTATRNPQPSWLYEFGE